MCLLFYPCSERPRYPLHRRIGWVGITAAPDAVDKTDILLSCSLARDRTKSSSVVQPRRYTQQALLNAYSQISCRIINGTIQLWWSIVSLHSEAGSNRIILIQFFELYVRGIYSNGQIRSLDSWKTFQARLKKKPAVEICTLGIKQRKHPKRLQR